MFNHNESQSTINGNKFLIKLIGSNVDICGHAVTKLVRREMLLMLIEELYCFQLVFYYPRDVTNERPVALFLVM